jgi:hypothetical protein
LHQSLSHYIIGTLRPPSQTLIAGLLLLPVRVYGRQLTKTERRGAQREARPSSASCWLHPITPIGSRPFTSPVLVQLYNPDSLTSDSCQNTDNGHKTCLCKACWFKLPESAVNPRRSLRITIPKVMKTYTYFSSRVEKIQHTLCIAISIARVFIKRKSAIYLQSEVIIPVSTNITLFWGMKQDFLVEKHQNYFCVLKLYRLNTHLNGHAHFVWSDVTIISLIIK